jgi:uncharacterized NAD-dependent epimerase/dehydratase family protein
VNTAALDDAGARRAIAEVAEATGLPADDPVRNGPERLFDAVEPLLQG